MTKRKIPYQVWLFLIFIHAAYAVIAFSIGNIYTVDSYGYLDQAYNLLHYHSWYSKPWNGPLLPDYFSFRPPLYATLIILCNFFSSSDYFILVIQNLISLFNCVLLYHIFTRYFNTKQSFTALAIVLIFYPAQFIYANLIMTEMVLQMQVLLLFYFMLKFIETPSFKRSWFIALLLCTTLLTKPVIVLFTVCIAVIILLKTYKVFDYKLFIPLLLVPIVFHLICLQNKHATGYYHFSSVKPVAHLKYNAKYTLVSKFGADYADSTISALMVLIDAQPDFRHRFELMQQSGTDIILNHPAHYANVYAKGIVAFFIDPGRFDLFHLFGIDDSSFNGLFHELNAKGFPAIASFIDSAPLGIIMMLFIILCWNIFVACAFFWFLLNNRFSFFLRLLVFLFVAYIAFASGALGVARFRFPVYPILALCTVFFIHHLQNKFGKHA